MHVLSRTYTQLIQNPMITRGHFPSKNQLCSIGAHFRRAFCSSRGPPSSHADKLNKLFKSDKKGETLYRRLVDGKTVDSHQPEFRFRSIPSESYAGVIKQKFPDDKHSEESSKLEMMADCGKDDLTNFGENIPLPDAEAADVTLLDKVSVWLSHGWEWFDGLQLEQIFVLILGIGIVVGSGYQKYIFLVAAGKKLAHIYTSMGIERFPLGVNRFAYTIRLPGLVHNSAVAHIESKSLRVSATVIKRGKEQILEHELLLPEGNYSRYTIAVQHLSELECVVVYVTGAESHHNIDIVIDRTTKTIAETKEKVKICG